MKAILIYLSLTLAVISIGIVSCKIDVGHPNKKIEKTTYEKNFGSLNTPQVLTGHERDSLLEAIDFYRLAISKVEKTTVAELSKTDGFKFLIDVDNQIAGRFTFKENSYENH